MLISVIVEKDHSLLLERSKNNTSALPNIEIEDSADPVSAIVAKCASFHIGIEVVRQYYSSNTLDDVHICFSAELISYTNTPKEKNVQWIDSRKIDGLKYSPKFEKLLSKIVSEYRTAYQYEKIIETCVGEMASLFGAKIEKSFGISSCNIFVQNNYDGYCPFIFHINYYVDFSQDVVNFSVSWPLKRMVSFGDKTDLYFLFSAMMAIVQKVFLGTSTFIEYLSLFDSYEISASCLLMLKKQHYQKNILLIRLRTSLAHIYYH